MFILDIRFDEIYNYLQLYISKITAEKPLSLITVDGNYTSNPVQIGIAGSRRRRRRRVINGGRLPANSTCAHAGCPDDGVSFRFNLR